MDTTAEKVTYTPGPWREGWDYKRISPDSDRVVAYAIGPQLSCLGIRRDPYGPLQPDDRTSEQMMADARLIAAAPDLLAAIDDACELLEDYMDVLDGDDGQPRPNKAMSMWQELDRIRAKARGERWPR